MRRKHGLKILCALLAVTVLLTAGCGEDNRSTESGSASGDAAGSFGTFEAELFSGEVVSQELFSQAKLTLVNVWATYCGYCIDEMPNFEKLAAAYKDKGLQVIGIVTDADAPQDETVGDIIEQTGVSYRQIMFNQAMYDTYLKDVQAVPTSLLVDTDGNVVKTLVGVQSYETWEKTLEELL